MNDLVLGTQPGKPGPERIKVLRLEKAVFLSVVTEGHHLAHADKHRTEPMPSEPAGLVVHVDPAFV